MYRKTVRGLYRGIKLNRTHLLRENVFGKQGGCGMNFKKSFWAIAITLVLSLAVEVEAAPPIMPSRIGGTLTVGGSQLNQKASEGYTFVVTKPDGTATLPRAEDTDGLNAYDSYVIDMPIYDPDNQPDGLIPGDKAVIHVYKDNTELSIVSPSDGEFSVGNSGSNTMIDISANLPETDNTPPFIEGFPTINYADNTIEVTYSEGGIQGAMEGSNYKFSPSLNFAVTGDQITNPSGNIFRLAMVSIPDHTIFTLTVTNITDAAGNPVTPSVVRINDNDGDDMADDWESDVCVQDPNDDPDNDGLTNLEEFNGGGTLSTDPNNPDTDNDGLPDAWEVNYGLDPLDATGSNGKYGDFDGDGWTNYEEYLGGLNPADEGSYPASPPSEMKEVIPHAGAGISDDTRVPNDTSFSVRIEDPDGIDITDTQSIAFTIDDGVNEIYRRDLSDSGVVRVVKLTTDQDTKVTRLWVVYDRCEEEGLGCYLYDASVNIKVDAKDSTQDWMIGASYDFAIESMSEHEEAQTPDNLPDTYEISPDDPDLADSQYSYDAGIQVMSGDLEGAKIIYNSSEPVTPRFGPIGELEGAVASGWQPMGKPMNLQPSTGFTSPVKIFIPCPGNIDLSTLSIFLFNGKEWVIACDTSGNVQPGGDGWMVPGSRKDHPRSSVSTIEIKVYHFTGAQAGIDEGSAGGASAAGSSVNGTTASNSGSGGGCFISTAASWGISARHFAILSRLRGLFSLQRR